MDLGVEDLDEDDQCLMELVLKMDSLKESSGESQEYWLLAITVAQEACRLQRGKNGGNDAVGDGQQREGM